MPYKYNPFTGTFEDTVQGTVVLKAGDTMTGVLAVIAGTAALPGIAVSGDLNTGIYSPGADQIGISTGGTERIRIQADGKLLLGTTTVGFGSQNGFTFEPASASYQTISHPNGAASGSDYEVFGYNGSKIGSISQSGTTAVLYNITSDQRLKENIVDAPEFGNVIDSIQVRSFDWITDQTHQRAGFIAQELVTVAPEAVHQPANPKEMMAVDYSKLVPMLVKEIQSLRTRLVAAGIA